MFNRPAPLLLPLSFVALSSLGCGDNADHTLIGPSAVSSSNAAYVSRGDLRVEPAGVVAQVVPAGACPAASPFVAPVNLVFRGDGAPGLTLSRVQMHFTDLAGTAAGFRTLTRVDLVARFGATSLPAFGTRTFPLLFPFGCVGLPAGTLTIVAFIVDAVGHETGRSVDVRLTVPPSSP